MDKNDKGFTLIELVVVITIIAILVAIAVGILSNSRRMAQEVTAKHDLKKFVQAEDAYYLEYGSYNGVAGDIISGDPDVPPTISFQAFKPSPQVVITINAIDPVFTASATYAGTGIVWQYRHDTGEITK